MQSRGAWSRSSFLRCLPPWS